MKSPFTSLTLVAALLAGCQSTTATEEQWLAKYQPKAIETAETAARNDFTCPNVKGTVTKSMDDSPRSVRFTAGPDQAAYRIDVTGCGQRQYFDVICRDDRTGCYVVGRAPVGR
jgi:hypothetical protein